MLTELGTYWMIQFPYYFSWILMMHHLTWFHLISLVACLGTYIWCYNNHNHSLFTVRYFYSTQFSSNYFSNSWSLLLLANLGIRGAAPELSGLVHVSVFLGNFQSSPTPPWFTRKQRPTTFPLPTLVDFHIILSNCINYSLINHMRTWLFQSKFSYVV